MAEKIKVGDMLYSEMGLKQRIKQLQNVSLRKEVKTFFQSIEQGEIQTLQNQYMTNEMRKTQLKEDLKTEVAKVKAKINAIEKDNNKLLSEITHHKREVQDDVYLVPNHAEKQILYIYKNGEVVIIRDMLDEERQGRLMLEETIPAKPIPDGTNVDGEDISHEDVTDTEDQAEEVEPKSNFYKDPAETAAEKDAAGELDKPKKKRGKGTKKQEPELEPDAPESHDEDDKEF